MTDRTVPEDEAVRLAVEAHAFADIDTGDTLSFSARSADGSPLPEWLGFDAQTRTLSGTPRNDDVGRYTLRVSASDLEGATASGDFSLTVTNVNDAPELSGALRDAATYQNAPLSYAIAPDTFIDVDAGDRLSFAAALAAGTPLPAWLAFDAASGVFSGLPDETQTGEYDIAVTARDGSGAAAVGLFSLHVSDAGAFSTTHRGTKRADTISTGPGNDFVDAGKGDDIISSGPGRDLAIGGKGDDTLWLGYGNDLGFGSEGRDRLDGGDGNDFLSGADGDDRMDGGAGNDVVTGGAGKDTLYGGTGNNLLIGGPGGDTLHGGPSPDVFAFNRRDGKATLHLGDGALPTNRDTLSFGAGITADDITLRRNGKDLIVKVDDAAEERDDGNVTVTLKEWYARGGQQAVTRLQLVGERIDVYDFTALVRQFDAATRGKNRPWRAAAALPHLRLASSDTEAFGGVIAHQYATTGDLGGVGLGALHAALKEATFASGFQSIANDSGETLAACLASSAGESGEPHAEWPAQPDFRGAPAPLPAAPSDEIRSGPRRSSGWPERSAVKPLDLQAILDATRTFAAQDADAQGGGRSRPQPGIKAAGEGNHGRTSGSSSWELTNALLQFHLSSAGGASLHGVLDQGGAQASLSRYFSGSAGQASVGVPGFGRDAHAMRPFSGLQEGLLRLT